MTIHHPYFGEFTQEGPTQVWEKTLNISAEATEITVFVDFPDRLDQGRLDQVAALIADFSALDQRIRQQLKQELGDPDSATASFFEISDLAGKSRAALEKMIDQLRLSHVNFYIDNLMNELTIAVWDYSIDPEEYDDVLAVGIDLAGNIINMAVES